MRTHFGSRRLRSSASPVTIASSRSRATITTDASMTSAVPLWPQSSPQARERCSSSGTIRTSSAARKRAKVAWRLPSRQACPTTPAGTRRASPRLSASASRAIIRLSPRSKAISAPASNVRLAAVVDRARALPTLPPPSSAYRAPKSNRERGLAEIPVALARRGLARCSRKPSPPGRCARLGVPVPTVLAEA